MLLCRPKIFIASLYFSLSPKRPDWLWLPSSLLSRGNRPGTLSAGVKRPMRQANQSLLASAEAKNAWSCNSTPTSSWHGPYLAHGQVYLTLRC